MLNFLFNVIYVIKIMSQFLVLQTQASKLWSIPDKVITPASLAPCARTMSFKHFYTIGKIYAEITGRFCIDHMSINAIPKDGEMLIFSKSPSFGYNLYATIADIALDTAISPTFYKNCDYYSWEDCYPQKIKHKILNLKEVKHGFKGGIVFVRNIGGTYFLYSFATKTDKESFYHYAMAYKELFLQMGDYCLQKLLPIYEQYASNTLDEILYFFKKNNTNFRPSLQVI